MCFKWFVSWKSPRSALQSHELRLNLEINYQRPPQLELFWALPFASPDHSKSVKHNGHTAAELATVLQHVGEAEIIRNCLVWAKEMLKSNVWHEDPTSTTLRGQASTGCACWVGAEAFEVSCKAKKKIQMSNWWAKPLCMASLLLLFSLGWLLCSHRVTWHGLMGEGFENSSRNSEQVHKSKSSTLGWIACVFGTWCKALKPEKKHMVRQLL